MRTGCLAEMSLRQYELTAEACTKPGRLPALLSQRRQPWTPVRRTGTNYSRTSTGTERRMPLRASTSPSRNSRHTSLVHPAVLDTVFHMLRQALRPSLRPRPPKFPIKMVNAWFSASGWQKPAHQLPPLLGKGKRGDGCR
jgi:hypothetical protein